MAKRNRWILPKRAGEDPWDYNYSGDVRYSLVGLLVVPLVLLAPVLWLLRKVGVTRLVKCLVGRGKRNDELPVARVVKE